MQRVAGKLAGAGVRSFALVVEDLYRPEFGLKDFSGALVKSLMNHPFEQVKLYASPGLADKLVSELGRWAYHFQANSPLELCVSKIPDAFEVKPS